MATRVAVSGATGRMGRAIAALAAEAGDIELVGGVGREERERHGGYARIATPERAGELIAGADVVLDVSAPPFLARLLDVRGEALEGRALVVGTTGLDDALVRRLDALAERAAVLVAANFSVGVNVLLALVEEAARRLGSDGYDVEIVEAHHRGKADAPSGTALALGQAVAAGRGAELAALRRDGRSGRTGARPAGEIGFHAVRGGAVAGEHTVLFLGTRERIALGHAAVDRSLFAEGALIAARWMAGRPPGRYTMRQVLGLD
ncbi:MAG TPA: 4-hydroxy-tetrahydrodipicolinate reductase [Longimicrobiales bacterium]